MAWSVSVLRSRQAVSPSSRINADCSPGRGGIGVLAADAHRQTSLVIGVGGRPEKPASELRSYRQSGAAVADNGACSHFAVAG